MTRHPHATPLPTTPGRHRPSRPAGLDPCLTWRLPLGLALGIGLGLVGGPAAWAASPRLLAEDPVGLLGSSTCPTSPARQDAAPPRRQQAAGNDWLAPGTGRAPTPASLDTLPRLGGINAIFHSYPFNIRTSQGNVKGTLYAQVIQTLRGTCDCYWQVEMAADSSVNAGVQAVRIQGFNHRSKRLLAGYRTDAEPNGIAPTWVTRSAIGGADIRFEFGNALKPGQVSRYFFLDSDYNATQPTGTVQVVTTTGASSRPALADVPLATAP